jgi:MarR family transcriptional regulator for hemolysin
MNNASLLDIRQLFGRQLARAARQWRLAMNERLLPYGLTEATWLPLLYIAREKPMRQKQLAELLGIESSSLVRLIDALVAAGLAERKIENDRRARLVCLTAQGRRLVAQVEAVGAEVRDQALAGISNEALAASFQVIERVSASLNRQRASE